MWLEVVKNVTKVTYLVTTIFHKLVMEEVLQPVEVLQLMVYLCRGANKSSVGSLSGMRWQK